MRVVVSLTTIMGREQLVRKTISSLLKQTWPPEAIYLWLPQEQFGGEVDHLDFPGVDVRIGPDQGPAMKLLPTLSIETDPDTAIITVDDDVEYPPQLIEKLVKTSGLLPDHAIGFTGWSVVEGTSESATLAHMNDGIPLASFFQPVQVLEGTRGVLYRRRFFAEDIVRHSRALEAFRYHDDILFSGYLASRGITRTVRWFDACPDASGNPWTIHCQDSGLHTTGNWFRLGWDCWNYWSTPRRTGIAPMLTTLSPADRLQLDAETCSRSGFTHHRRVHGDTETAMTHPLERFPWPWPDDRFDEVLALDVFDGPSVDSESCLAECRRILKPCGVLVFRVRIETTLWSSIERQKGRDIDAHTLCLLMNRRTITTDNPALSQQQALKNLRLAVEHDGRHCTVTMISPAPQPPSA